ncbi:MAG: hypothetical protein ACOZCL_18770 [Bacillota bacterium]
MKKYFGGFSIIISLMIVTIAVLNIYTYQIGRNNINKYKVEKISADIGRVLYDENFKKHINAKDVEEVIRNNSEDFVKAAFRRDKEALAAFLDTNTEYILNRDGSSFIRYISNVNHVEGYMATDEALSDQKLKWYVENHDRTITSCVEIKVKDKKKPFYWYLHFRRKDDGWKLFMLENDL